MGSRHVMVVGAVPALARALMTVLEQSGIEAVTDRPFEIKAAPEMHAWPVLALPSEVRPSYGPKRKGRGGKPRRW